MERASVMIELQVSKGLQVEGRFCFPDSGDSIRLGRADDSDIMLGGLSVAKRHCELRRGRSGWILMDAGSLSGTRVNQQLVQEYGPLKIGDQIEIGSWRLAVMGTQVAEPPVHIPLDRVALPHVQSSPGIRAPLKQEGHPQPWMPSQLRQALLKLRVALERRRREWSSMSDEALRLETAELAEAVASEITDLEPSVRAAFVQRLVAESVGYGPLEPLLSDPEVTEIMVNGPSAIFVERGGRCEQANDAFSDAQSLRLVLERMFSPLGRRLDESHPMADGRLPCGSRINAVLSPPAVGGHSLTIRRFPEQPLKFEELMSAVGMPEAMSSYLRSAVKARKNLIVSGGTGSGKTTLLRALAAQISAHERVVTIEDSAELALALPNLVALECRDANHEGQGAIRIRDLVRNALRMRPDRIIVGECRGGEALDMLQAMNTGHEGSMTTAHANNPRELLGRLEVMVLMAGFDLPVQAIREQIAGALDLIIQQRRFSDGTRRIESITEVCGMESGKVQLQTLMEWSASAQEYRLL
jgi:pilus assembly protein CpaF